MRRRLQPAQPVLGLPSAAVVPCFAKCAACPLLSGAVAEMNDDTSSIAPAPAFPPAGIGSSLLSLLPFNGAIAARDFTLLMTGKGAGVAGLLGSLLVGS